MIRKNFYLAMTAVVTAVMMSACGSVPAGKAETACVGTGSAGGTETTATVKSKAAGAGHFTSEDVGDGTVRITAYVQDDMEDLIIPDKLNGKDVTEIGGFNNSKIKSVTIPDTVRKINGYAFYNCQNLKKVTLDDKLQVIGGLAFNTCPKLTEITIPDNVEEIGPQAFTATGITEVKLPRKLKSLTTAFNGTNIKKLVVPGNVRKIEDSAFFCSTIEEVDIEEGVGTVGETVFYNSPSLKKVVLPASLTSIGNGNFDNCPNVSVTAPAGSYAESYAR